MGIQDPFPLSHSVKAVALQFLLLAQDHILAAHYQQTTFKALGNLVL